MKGSFEIVGASDVLKALRELPKEYQGKELAKSTGKGARVIRDEARDNAPVLKTAARNRTPGTLRNAIRSTSGSRKIWESQAFVYVRVLTKKAVAKFKRLNKGVAARDNPNDPFYWRFQEFGTVKMRAANGGRGFMRPAFDAKKEQAAEVIKEELWKGIERVAKRVAARRLW